MGVCVYIYDIHMALCGHEHVLMSVMKESLYSMALLGLKVPGASRVLALFQGYQLLECQNAQVPFFKRWTGGTGFCWGSYPPLHSIATLHWLYSFCVKVWRILESSQ